MSRDTRINCAGFPLNCGNVAYLTLKAATHDPSLSADNDGSCVAAFKITCRRPLILSNA